MAEKKVQKISEWDLKYEIDGEPRPMNRSFWALYKKGAQFVAFTYEGKRMGRVMSVDSKFPRVKVKIQGFQSQPWLWFMPDKDGYYFLGSWKMKSCREKGYNGWKHWKIVPNGKIEE